MRAFPTLAGAEVIHWAVRQLGCRLIADVIGTPTFRTVDQEVGATGAFIAGLVAVGKATDFSSATKDYLQIRDMFEPHKERHARYDELFEQLLAVRQSTLPMLEIHGGWPRSIESGGSLI
jgi:sugar (pentulose or hexulose) kinase